MSWVTVIWSMVAAACLTLAAMHLLVWLQNRSKRDHLLFSLAAIGIASVAMVELGMMRAATPEQFAALVRWYHVPAWVVILSLVGFVRLYLQAGRPWLGWTVCGVRTLSLLLNFTTGQNLNFREVVSLHHVTFLGESVSVGLGVVNPWALTGQLSQMLLAVFAADAAIVIWRRGDRRRALTVGGSIVVFPLVGTTVAVLVSWGIAPVPVVVSLAFLGVVVAVAWELSREAIRATQLGDDLRESEARYRDIFDGAIEGMFRTSLEGRILVANPALAKMLGYESAAEIIQTVQDSARQIWANPDERARYIRQLQEDGGGRVCECQFKRKGGTRIWVSLSSRAVRGPDGRVLCFDGFVEDISERKSAEQSLIDSRERLRLAAAAAMFGAYQYDFATGQAFYSPEFAALYGLPEGAEIALDSDYVPKAIHPDDRAAFLTRMQAANDPHGSGVFELEFRILRPDGQVRWLRTRGLTVFAGQGPDRRPLRANGIIQDVTDRRQAEASLREIQIRLTSGAELAGLGFYEMTGGENVTYIDERVRAICGIPPDRAQGVRALEFWFAHIHPDDFARMQDVHQRLEDGRLERISVEYRYVHPDGREIWIHHLAAVMKRDSAGRQVHMIGVMRDVTAQKCTELELVQQRMQLAHVARVATVGQLAASLAHELNQPLGAILRNAEAAELLLADQAPDLEELRAILVDIRADDQRAGAVIDRMRDLLRRRTIDRQPLDLRVVSGEVISLARSDAEAHRVRVSLEATPALPPVLGSRVQLQQVLLNLLLNAMDALNGSSPERRHIVVRVQLEGATVEVSVSDSGPGIPAGKLSQIFEPFFTTKPNGLGMGLAISRSIVEAHGGRFWARNNPGGGAVFTFALPVAGELGGARDRGREVISNQ